MRLYQLLGAVDPDLEPRYSKLHLAIPVGGDNPLDLYLDGGFDEWQCVQNKKNFPRPHVVSLIQMPGANRWLFAGAYDSRGCSWNEAARQWRYDLQPRIACIDLQGRLVVSFKRPGRQSYLCCERWDERLEVSELRAERLRVAEFRSYSWTMLTKQHLDIVVREQDASWKAALSAVAGVYVIVDRATGKMYVGSATGSGGIWNRWCAYAATGHGGNRELRELLGREGIGHAENFQFGILEIADTNSSAQHVLDREGYWKHLLLSSRFGYNAS